jgi:cobalamin synthase
MKKRKTKFAETADAYLLASHLVLIASAADASVWAGPALIIFVHLFSCCMLISWYKASCRVSDRTYTRAKALRLACLAPAALLAVCAHPPLGFWPPAAFALACASACLAYLCTLNLVPAKKAVR